MSDMNRVIIIGRLTRDSELKTLGSGTSVSNFSIAISEYMGQDKEEYTSFFDCVMYGKRAEGLAPYLKKGQQVGVEGTLHQSRWDSEAGKRSKVEIKVSNIQLVGGKKDHQEAEKPIKDSVNGPFEDDLLF